MQNVDRRGLASSGLSREAIEEALDLTGLRPSGSDWREFAARTMRFAGVLSLAAGVVFLVAFNWQNLGIYARFAMLQVALLAAVAGAWIKGTESLSGKLALMLAVLLTGALLALFGQTYQTGADVYELFLGWAALALPWVVACRYSPCWALWLLLLNLAVGLYSTIGHRGWLLVVIFEHWAMSPWTLLFLLNLLLYVTVSSLARWPVLGLSDGWLRRGIMAAAMAFGTFVAVYRVTGNWNPYGNTSTAPVFEILLYVAASAAFATHAYARRSDLFHFAVLALSWIVVTTTLIGRAMLEDQAGIGALFIIAMYVIAASTGAVKGISYLGRQWRTEEPAA